MAKPVAPPPRPDRRLAHGGKRIQIDLLLELVEQLDLRIKPLDRRVQQLVKADPAAQRLQSWPGIGPFGAALLPAERGDIGGLRPLLGWRPAPKARAGGPRTVESGARGVLGSNGSSSRLSSA